MKQLQKLVGEKCFLTPADGSVADIVAEWSNDLDLSIKTGDISDMITYDLQKQYLQEMNSSRGYAFYIVDKTNEKVIGVARLMRISFINRNAVMGMFIGDKNIRSGGIGTDASMLLLDFAFNVLNLRNIMVEIFSFNKASINMCRKCGFKEIGRRRKAILYGKNEFDEVYMDILSEEFDNSIIDKQIKKIEENNNV